ncbi:MAG: zinc ribbon domain-containing protein [Burkholderiales bacterium]|nr:zinc ribbon domain-containing protein [Burkholderiales bacterium]
MQADVSKASFNPAYLIRSTEALTQWRPLLLNFLSLMLAGMVASLGATFALKSGSDVGRLMALVMFLLAFMITAAGFSGAGVMLMDRAKRIPARSMVDAIVFGFLCLPKFLGFLLVLLLVGLVATLVAAIVYAVCKIPGLGALLLFFAHPVLVLIAAILFIAIVWAVIPMFTPAVWDGRSFKESLSVVFVAARNRLFQVIMSLIALYCIVAIIGAVVFGGLFVGLSSMTAIAAMLMSDVLNTGLGSFFALFMSGGGEVSGQAYAFMASSGIIFGVAGALMAQVFIMGVNLVYLQMADGLDLSETQAKLDQHIELARQKAKAAQARAIEAAERARQQRPASVEAAQQPPAVIPNSDCPKCGGSVAPDDLFCGGCGHKLK